MRAQTAGVLGAVLVALAVALVILLHSGAEKGAGGVAPAESAIHYTEGVETWYRNEMPAFSFRLPDGFTAPNGAAGAGGGEEVIVINGTEDAATLFVFPIATGANLPLTEDIVRANAGGATVSDFTPASLGNGIAGLRFSTDAKAWDGDGIAFWFIHDGYLYELSTARKNAELLALLMQTFTFPVAPGV